MIALLGLSLAQNCTHVGVNSALLSWARPRAEGRSPRYPLRSRPRVPARPDPGEGASETWAATSRISPPAASETSCHAKSDAGGTQRKFQAPTRASDAPQGIYAGPIPEVRLLLLCLHSAKTTVPLSGLFAWWRTLGFGHSKYKCT